MSFEPISSHRRRFVGELPCLAVNGDRHHADQTLLSLRSSGLNDGASQTVAPREKKRKNLLVLRSPLWPKAEPPGVRRPANRAMGGRRRDQDQIEGVVRSQARLVGARGGWCHAWKPKVKSRQL
ncbi:hypothetical protein J1N35_032810 [Gossypium stocksii]|uniref:Uncharacterized protein n=1 Tax=Gossypium stocksii TaxID=47602 RepID=A0A9D3ZW21_9ROSI|nr:hypothetical protein J1N35_032810 [Gossypium stocksii]